MRQRASLRGYSERACPLDESGNLTSKVRGQNLSAQTAHVRVTQLLVLMFADAGAFTRPNGVDGPAPACGDSPMAGRVGPGETAGQSQRMLPNLASCVYAMRPASRQAIEESGLRENRAPVIEKNLRRSPHRDPAADEEALAQYVTEALFSEHSRNDVTAGELTREERSRSAGSCVRRGRAVGDVV